MFMSDQKKYVWYNNIVIKIIIIIICTYVQVRKNEFTFYVHKKLIKIKLLFLML